MDVTTETIATREVEFTIHPDPEQVGEAKRQAARLIAKRVRIPGFRPGKAPYALVERSVGKEAVTEEAAEIMAPDLYKQILEQGGYQPYDRPTLTIARHEPLELKIRVALEPSVELGDYCAMKVEPEPEARVTPEQEEQLLAQVREQHGTWVPVERAAAIGDQVTIDLKGTADGETVFDETGTALTLEETLSPPGFAAAVAGMQPGETREFSLTYPEGAPQEGLAGKTVTFVVTLRELKERHLPTLDDEFARSLGDYQNLDDLRTRLRERLQAQLDTEGRGRLAIRALDQLVEQSKIEYPNLAVEREIDELVRQRENRLRQQGFTLESYLRAAHKSAIQLRDELRPEAERDLRRSLVLHALVKAERIQVSPDELAQEVDRMAEPYGEQAQMVRQTLTQSGPLALLLDDIYTRKALERLVDVVTGKVQGVCATPQAEPAAAEAQSQAAPEEPPAEPQTE